MKTIYNNEPPPDNDDMEVGDEYGDTEHPND